MGGKKYTDAEKQFVIDNYGKMTAQEIANSLDRTVSVSAVKGLAKRLGVAGKPSVLFSDEEVQFVQDNYLTMTSSEIAEKIGRTIKSIESIKYRLGLKKNDWDWNDESLAYLRNNYNNMPVKEIAKNLNKDIDTIYNKAYNLGLKKDIYTINEKYFENIDTPEKSYWLGFLITDGYIRVHSEGKKTLSIGLKEEDIGHLYKFRQAINSNAPVKKNVGSRGHNMVSFSITNNKLCNDLIKWGVLPAKTYKEIHIPKIKQEYMGDFIRGYWDGDGCVTIRVKNGKESSPALSAGRITFDIMNELQYEFYKVGVTSNIYEGKNTSGKPSYRLTLYGRENVCLALDFMYKDSTVYLDRKYEIAKKILNLWSPNKETY